jgi:hypothetical protein
MADHVANSREAIEHSAGLRRLAGKIEAEPIDLSQLGLQSRIKTLIRSLISSVSLSNSSAVHRPYAPRRRAASSLTQLQHPLPYFAFSVLPLPREARLRPLAGRCREGVEPSWIAAEGFSSFDDRRRFLLF